MNSRHFVRAAAIIAFGCLIVLAGRHARYLLPPGLGSSSAKPVVQSATTTVGVAEMTFQDLDGQKISTRNWKGRVTIVNFWATWCPPCRTEIPDFIQLQNRYRDQLQIIGISVDRGSIEHVRQFVREYMINYPVAMDTPQIGNLFPGLRGLPTSFVLDRDAKIVQQYVGRMSLSTYELEIRRLAGLPTDTSSQTPGAGLGHAFDR